MKAIDLIKSLSDRFGDTWVSCEEPESITICLDDADAPDDMIEAIKTCVVSDLPWADPYVFENIVDGICGNPVFADTLTTPPLEEICASVHFMRLIKPGAAFSRDVMKYICSCAMSDGLVWLPQGLLFAADFMTDTDSGLQLMVKKSIEASGWPVYDYPYEETPVEIQLLKLAAIEMAANDIINGCP